MLVQGDYQPNGISQYICVIEPKVSLDPVSYVFLGHRERTRNVHDVIYIARYVFLYVIRSVSSPLIVDNVFVSKRESVSHDRHVKFSFILIFARSKWYWSRILIMCSFLCWLIFEFQRNAAPVIEGCRQFDFGFLVWVFPRKCNVLLVLFVRYRYYLRPPDELTITISDLIISVQKSFQELF